MMLTVRERRESRMITKVFGLSHALIEILCVQKKKKENVTTDVNS